MATPNNMSETQDEFSRLKADEAPQMKSAHTSARAKLNPADLTALKQMQTDAAPKLSPEDELAKRFANRPGGSYEFNAPLETNLGAISNINQFTGEMRTDRLQPGPSIQSEVPSATPEAPVVTPTDVPDPTTDGTFGMGGGAETTTMQPPGGNLVTAANTLGAPEAAPLVGDLIDTFQPGKDDPFAWLAMFQQGKQMSTDLANRSQRKFNNLVKARKTEADTVTGDFQRAVLSDVFKHGGQVTKRFDAIGNLVFPNLLSQKTAATSAQTAALKAQQDAMGITSTPVSEGMPGEPGQVVWNVKGAEAAPLTMNTDEQVKILPIMQELQQSGLSPYQAAVEALMTIRGQR
jgi:hypothetical protein